MYKTACGNGFPLNIPSEIPTGGGGGASSASQVSYNNTDSGLTARNVQAAIDEMVANFGDGVDSVYNACVAAGSTPSSKSPADIATAIGNISGGPVMFLNNGKVATSESEYISAEFDISPQADDILLISLLDGADIVNFACPYAGGSQSITIPGGYTAAITATTFGLSYYTGNYRDIYAKVSSVNPTQVYTPTP